MAPAGGVSLKRFGSVEVAVVSACTILGWTPTFAPGQDWITLDTDVDADGAAIGGLNWLVIRTPAAVVLVDPAQIEPGDGSGSARFIPNVSLDGALAELGVRPAEVTHVVITHFHADHLCGLVDQTPAVPRFPNARHIVPSRDWQTFIVDDVRGNADELMKRLGPVADAGLLELVDGDAEVAAGIAVIATPGESPGHLAVKAETPGGAVYYLGDLIHFPVEVEQIDWAAVQDRPIAALVESRRRIFGGADENALFVYTHSRFPCWGRIEQTGPGAWVWRYLEPDSVN